VPLKDPSSATDVNLAFYTLDNTGSLIGDATHQIPEDASGRMIAPITGILQGYRYSVSYNTETGFILNGDVTIPTFAIASGNYPSGFEVVAIGPSSARQVFMQLVLAAEGSFKGTLPHRQTLLTSFRDIW